MNPKRVVVRCPICGAEVRVPLRNGRYMCSQCGKRFGVHFLLIGLTKDRRRRYYYYAKALVQGVEKESYGITEV